MFELAVERDLALITGMIAVFLAAMHFFAGRLRFLNVTPRSRWLSFAGGVSVAYVFIHILPKLSKHQQTFDELDIANSVTSLLEHHVYLVALFGLIMFYSLEQWVHRSKHKPSVPDNTSAGVFWLHIGTFGVYNALVGYLLVHREEPGIQSLIWYAVALGLHFLVNDYGLRKHHPDRYQQYGRYGLAMAVVVGWFIGIVFEVHALALALIFSFLGGSVILNVLKEELPADREGHIGAFIIGAMFSTVLLIAL